MGKILNIPFILENLLDRDNVSEKEKKQINELLWFYKQNGVFTSIQSQIIENLLHKYSKV